MCCHILISLALQPLCTKHLNWIVSDRKQFSKLKEDLLLQLELREATIHHTHRAGSESALTTSNSGFFWNCTFVSRNASYHTKINITSLIPIVWMGTWWGKCTGHWGVEIHPAGIWWENNHGIRHKQESTACKTPPISKRSLLMK